MASKQNIKETMNLLCKIINQHGGSKLLTPETFRLAKFNNDEATGPMWKLLWETNRFLNCGSFQCSEHKEDLVLCTKHELFTKGYYVRDFFILPENMNYGSREILLALGWLMSRKKLLQVLLNNHCNLLEECLPLIGESLNSSNQDVCTKSINNSQKFSTTNLHDLPNLEQLSWMLGNVKFTWNGLYSCENHLVSLVNNVHSATLGAMSTKGHLSALEVFLLRHPKELIEFQGEIDKCNSYLGNILKFIELQDVFWKWMDSVYKAKVVESKENIMVDFGFDMNQHCQTCEENSDKELKKVSEIQSELQRVFEDGRTVYLKTCKVVQSSKPCNDLNEREWAELNEKMDCLSLHPVVCRNELQTFPEFKQLSPSVTIPGNVKHLEPSCAQQEIKILKSKIVELEVELMELRKLHFDILNELTANLPELVCIPPIGASKYNELKNK